jgi:phage major head subunit gpT-like protein
MADINILTGLMHTQFLQNMQSIATPAPVDNFVTDINSTQRIERYPWMYPPPRIARFMGKRRKAVLGQIRYDVENYEFDATITVPLRDLEDDQYGGYRIRMNQLMDDRTPFKARQILTTLANGASLTCFDGTNFFASSHNIGGAGSVPSGFGGGGNNLTYTASGTSDGKVHLCAILIHADVTNKGVKPMLWQLRKPFRFHNDAGTPLSQKVMQADYWIHGEFAAAFGYWWDAILCTITNTPGLLDIFTILDGFRQTFRRFTLPKNLPGDQLQRVHEQFSYNKNNVTIVTDTYMEALFNHVLNEERIGVAPNTLATGTTAGFTNNIYRDKFAYIPSAFFDQY